MKKIILILFSLIAILTSCGQNNNLNKRFQKDIIKYREACNDKDWDKVIDMIYPKLFDSLSKPQMTLFFMLAESIGPKTVLEFNRIDSLSDIFVNGNEKYCRIYYSGLLKFNIGGDISSKDVDQLKKNCEDKYGAKNFQFDEKQHLFIIKSDQSMIAISDKDKNDWKYVEYSGAMKQMFIKIIPEEVHKMLGE
jgi:hypothetical protein